MSEQIFSVKRADLAFDFAKSLEQAFAFAVFKDQPATTNEGSRLTESLGYDFQSECSPYVEIYPLSDEIVESIGVELNDLNFNITIEDIALNTRKFAFSIAADEVVKMNKYRVDLKSYEDLSFHRGFEVRCFITRRNNVGEISNKIWNKSQLISLKSFEVRASLDEALFDISWVRFSDKSLREDVLMYVEWLSPEVSHIVDKDCFVVKANEKYKDQIKRLESNNHFGGFCIRMIVEKILVELLQKTLRYADISEGASSQVDSLHDRFQILLEKNGEDFIHLAKAVQSSNKIEQLQAETKVVQMFQKFTKLGTILGGLKFGGYR